MDVCVCVCGRINVWAECVCKIVCMCEYGWECLYVIYVKVSIYTYACAYVCYMSICKYVYIYVSYVNIDASKCKHKYITIHIPLYDVSNKGGTKKELISLAIYCPCNTCILYPLKLTILDIVEKSFILVQFDIFIVLFKFKLNNTRFLYSEYLVI